MPGKGRCLSQLWRQITRWVLNRVWGLTNVRPTDQRWVCVKLKICRDLSQGAKSICICNLYSFSVLQTSDSTKSISSYGTVCCFCLSLQGYDLGHLREEALTLCLRLPLPSSPPVGFRLNLISFGKPSLNVRKQLVPFSPPTNSPQNSLRFLP